jgi:hypothetical protein
MSEMTDHELKRIYDQEKDSIAKEADSLSKEININIDLRKSETYKEVESK